MISGQKDFKIDQTMPEIWAVKVVTLTLTHPVFSHILKLLKVIVSQYHAIRFRASLYPDTQNLLIIRNHFKRCLTS